MTDRIFNLSSYTKVLKLYMLFVNTVCLLLNLLPWSWILDKI